ncbi:MAG: hypothetical protein K0U36_06915 [Alphaproteobacteria bacterium]|nr:hypothetical protein [Alphaproteobacteria bacterium]
MQIITYKFGAVAESKLDIENAESTDLLSSVEQSSTDGTPWLVYRVDCPGEFRVPLLDCEEDQGQDTLACLDDKRPIPEQLEENDEIILSPMAHLDVRVEFEDKVFELESIPISILTERVFNWALRQANIDPLQHGSDYELHVTSEDSDTGDQVDLAKPLGCFATQQKTGRWIAIFLLVTENRWQGDKSSDDVSTCLMRAETRKYISDWSIEDTTVALNLHMRSGQTVRLNIDFAKMSSQPPLATITEKNVILKQTQNKKKLIDHEHFYGPFDRYWYLQKRKWRRTEDENVWDTSWSLFRYIKTLRNWL